MHGRIGCETIRTRHFAIFELGYSLLHFMEGDRLEKHEIVVISNDFWNMLRDGLNGLISVALWFSKNILKILSEFVVNVFMSL